MLRFPRWLSRPQFWLEMSSLAVGQSKTFPLVPMSETGAHWRYVNNTLIQLLLRGYSIHGVTNCAIVVHNWGLVGCWVLDLPTGCRPPRGPQSPLPRPWALAPPPLLSLLEPSKHCLLACISQQTVLHLLHYMSTGPFSRRSTLTHWNILLPLSRCKHQNFFQCSKIVSILAFHFCFCFKATVMIRCFANIPCIQKIFNI